MTPEALAQLRSQYPPGTRLQLLRMNDPYLPVPSGTRGTVQCVDDLGQLQMRWDNGRGLALIPGEDDFRKLTAAELAAQKNEIYRNLLNKMSPRRPVR